MSDICNKLKTCANEANAEQDVEGDDFESVLFKSLDIATTYTPNYSSRPSDDETIQSLSSENSLEPDDASTPKK